MADVEKKRVKSRIYEATPKRRLWKTNYERCEKRRRYKKEYDKKVAKKTRGRKIRYRLANKEHISEVSKLYQKLSWKQLIISTSKKDDIYYNRPFTLDEYVTEKFITEQLLTQTGLCIYCHTTMIYGEGVDRRVDDMALTIQRMDNDIAHICTNSVLACRVCNQRAKNIPHEIMLEHGNNLRDRFFRYCAYKDHEGSRVVLAEDYTVSGTSYCRNCERKRGRARAK